MYGQKSIKLCDVKQVYHYKNIKLKLYRVTVPYAAHVHLYPPEDEHLRIETCKGEYYFMNK